MGRDDPVLICFKCGGLILLIYYIWEIFSEVACLPNDMDGYMRICIIGKESY